MKRAKQMAWGAMGGLLTMAAILVIAGIFYHVTAFWAGAMLAGGQALVMGLAAWGLSLGEQAQELNEYSRELAGVGTGGRRAEAGPGGFRMSMGGDETAARVEVHADEPKVLDTGFQRLVVFISGLVLAIFSALSFLAAYFVYAWAQLNPDSKVPIAGTLAMAKAGKPLAFDEMALLAGLAASAGYIGLYVFTRPSRQTGVHGDAASSNFTLGLTGMAALGVASVLGYFRVVWASEIAAVIIGAFLLLQALELMVNAFRNYSSIEEMDQDTVDLQATPIGPMLSSMWLGGLRMLVAQSVGLHSGGKKGGAGGGGERSVVARMMPRALAACVVIAIAASCFRVVPPGQVAIMERLGYTPTMGPEDPRPQPDSILHSGLHVTMPWPIDRLVYLPTEELQLAEVGTELHAPGEWKKVDFQFWQIRPETTLQEEWKDLFNTGEAGSPQFLETYIQVRWRVADPSRFYAAMSHSEMFDPAGASANEQALPIYEAMVKQATAEAVTKTFAIHSLEQIMLTDRQEVELHCRAILQQRLDELCALPGDKAGEKHRGIDIAYLTIKDLHPPKGPPDKQDSSKPVIGGQLVETDKGYDVMSNPAQPSTIARGPASAFEFVVSMREFEQEIINTANAQAIKAKNDAHGQAQSAIADARTYSAVKVAQARGDADRFVEMTRDMSPADLELMKQRLLLDTTRNLLEPVTKIVADPTVSDIQIIQGTGNNTGAIRPPPGN